MIVVRGSSREAAQDGHGSSLKRVPSLLRLDRRSEIPSLSSTHSSRSSNGEEKVDVHRGIDAEESDHRRHPRDRDEGHRSGDRWRRRDDQSDRRWRDDRRERGRDWEREGRASSYDGRHRSERSERSGRSRWDDRGKRDREWDHDGQSGRRGDGFSGSERREPDRKYSERASDKKQEQQEQQPVDEKSRETKTVHHDTLLEERERQVDLEWYGMEEDAVHDEERQSHFLSFLSDARVKEREEKTEKQRTQRMTHRAAQMMEDRNLWEENRLMTSGVGGHRTFTGSFDEGEDGRVHLMVHNIRPSFLGEKGGSFQKIETTVMPVRDPTSDMATIARKGSDMLRYVRQQKERMAAVKERFKISGTMLGNIMGVTDKDEEDEDSKKDRFLADKMEVCLFVCLFCILCTS
jgi:pre-mRNA-splicing factor ATP-dependent RNA helicase DHX38/PRP16